MTAWNLADVVRSGRRCRARAARARAGRPLRHLGRARRARGAPRERVPRARPRTRLEGRALPLQLQRVRRGLARDVQAPRCPRQRELPLPRRRARVPHRQLRCRDRGVPRCARRADGRGARPLPERAGRRAGRRRITRARRGAALRGSPRRLDADGAHPTLRRRPVLPLHRRHDGHAEGRDVAPRGPLRRARRGGLPRPRRADPRRHAKGSAPRRHGSARATVHRCTCPRHR